MTCHDVQPQLELFLDGMLDDARSDAVQRHLDTCAPCRAVAEETQRFEDQLRTAFQDEAVPDALWARIESDLAQVASVADAPVSRPSRKRWTWSSVAAAAVVFVLGLALLKPWLLPASLEARVLSVPVQDLHTFVVSRRQLDFASTAPEGVRHWFEEKVDFALPRLPQTIAGAQLVGGRLCHFLERRVASYMYTVKDRYLSLYVMPQQGLPLPAGAITELEQPPAGVHVVQGYTHILWSQSGLLYSLVSDLPQPQLINLARVVAQAG